MATSDPGDRKTVVFVAPNIGKRPNNTNRLYTLALLYLSNAARVCGWNTAALDAYFSELDEDATVAAILEEVPDALGFSLYSEEMSDAAQRIIGRVREVTGRPIPCLVGGHYATIEHARLIATVPAFDYIVLGEGEAGLQDVLRALNADAGPAPLPGVTRREAGQPRIERRRPTAPDIDRYGSLDFGLCHEAPGPAEFSLVTSRGCDAACSFCVIGPHWGRYGEWRGHSAGWVVDQVEQLVRDRGATYVQFVDDQFFGSERSIARAFEMTDLMKARSLKVPFYILARADSVAGQPELCRALTEVGLETVFMGLESASEDSLARFNKKCRPEDAERAAALLDGLGVKTVAGTIVFTPWMTDTILRTELAFLSTLLERHSGFQFFGLNELDVLETTAMAPAFRGGGRGWRYDWTAEDPAMGWTFATWQRLQGRLLFPAMEVAPPERRLALRRDYCRWQINALTRVLDRADSRRLVAGDTAMMFAGLCRLLLEHAGPDAVKAFSAATSRPVQVEGEAERCFG